MTDSTRFAFTKVFVDDLSAEASFYCSIFGLKEKARLSVGEGADALEEVILTSGRGDDSSLVLWRYLARATPTPGEATVGFNVSDIHSTVKRVTESGGRVVELPNELPGHGVLYSFVTDPEGHLIEIVQNC
jgi:predicted enzyme related to lactoylglutathione lyase